MAVAIAVLLLILALFGLKAAGILKLGGSLPDNTLALGGKGADNNLLMARGKTGPPVLNEQGSVPKPLKMPQDVWDWLEHLRRIEARKNDLHLKQVSELKVFQQMIGVLGPGIGEVDPYDQTGDAGKEPADVTKGKFADLRPDWYQLIKDFQAVPPPDECKPIADDYYRAINEIPGMTGDVIGVLNTVSTDPQGALTAVSKLRNKSYGEIDRYLDRTDARVQAICDKYNVRKWFNIKTDVAGSDMLGKAGF